MKTSLASTLPVRRATPRRKFGLTGLNVSTMGLGTEPAGDRGASVMRSLIDACVEQGINLIDTAPGYGTAESSVGKALQGRRDKFVIVGKCGDAGSADDADCWSPRAIRRSLERSLKRLKTDRIDVMLLHACSREILARGEAWEVLQAAKREGKIRFAGYAGDNGEAAFAATLEGMDVLELSINLCDQWDLTRVVPVAGERDIAVIAKRPLANFAWTPDADISGFVPKYALPYRKRLESMGFTGKRVVPFPGWSEIALRFVLSLPGVHCAITGPVDPAALVRNAGLARKGALPKETVSFLQERYAEESCGRWHAVA